MTVTELAVDELVSINPAVTVQAVDSEDEAVRLANDSRYGLGASVWTRDLIAARRVAARLEAGMVDADRGRVPVPWWCPYAPELVDGFRGFARALHGRGLVPRVREGWADRRGLGRLARRYLSPR